MSRIIEESSGEEEEVVLLEEDFGKDVTDEGNNFSYYQSFLDMRNFLALILKMIRSTCT